MPEEGIDFSSRQELLNYDEILKLAKIFKSLGVQKVRITGGEPLIRKDVDYLLRGLNDIYGSIHLTTNATVLHQHFHYLQDVNLTAMNISIDSLNENTFAMITRRDQFDQVMTNIQEAKNQGFHIKLNIVVMKGVNDHEIKDFIEFGMSNGIEIRFIEAMPFNQSDGNKQLFMSYIDILSKINEHYNVVRLENEKPSSSIKYLVDDKLNIGIIPAYSRSLCGSCNRIRITPQGELLTCLYAHQGISLRDMLRNRYKTEEDLRNTIMNAVLVKAKDGFQEEKEQKDKEVYRSMTTIGG